MILTESESKPLHQKMYRIYSNKRQPRISAVAHPRKDNLRGRQVSSSKPEGLIKTPNTLTHADDHCKSKGGSSRPHSSHPTTDPYTYPNLALNQNPFRTFDRSQRQQQHKKQKNKNSSAGSSDDGRVILVLARFEVCI